MQYTQFDISHLFISSFIFKSRVQFQHNLECLVGRLVFFFFYFNLCYDSSGKAFYIEFLCLIVNNRFSERAFGIYLFEGSAKKIFIPKRRVTAIFAAKEIENFLHNEPAE